MENIYLYVLKEMSYRKIRLSVRQLKGIAIYVQRETIDEQFGAINALPHVDMCHIELKYINLHTRNVDRQYYSIDHARQ